MINNEKVFIKINFKFKSFCLIYIVFDIDIIEININVLLIEILNVFKFCIIYRVLK